MGRNRKTVPRRKSPRYVNRSISEMRKMLKYFRTPWSSPKGCRSSASTAPSDRLMAGLLVRAALLENAGNDLVERRVLHAHVHNGVAVEYRAEQFRHSRAVD